MILEYNKYNMMLLFYVEPWILNMLLDDLTATSLEWCLVGKLSPATETCKGRHEESDGTFPNSKTPFEGYVICHTSEHAYFSFKH